MGHPPERGLQSAGSHAGAGTSLRAEARAPRGFTAIAHGRQAQDTSQPRGEIAPRRRGGIAPPPYVGAYTGVSVR